MPEEYKLFTNLRRSDDRKRLRTSIRRIAVADLVSHVHQSTFQANARFIFNPFPGHNFEMNSTSTNVHKDGTRIVHAMGTDSDLRLTTGNRGDGYYLIAHGADGNYEVVARGSSLHIRELEPNSHLKCGGGIPMRKQETRKERLSPQAGTDEVTVLVVYTAEALTEAGSADSLVAIVRVAESNANQIYRNSRVDLKINIVGIEQIAFNEGASLSDDLDRIPKDATTLALRDRYAADLVALVRFPDHQYFGISFQLGPDSGDDGQFAFSLVDDQHIARYDVLAHELGHQLGCQHDRPNADSTPLFDYSYGQSFVGNSGHDWGTVMSYAGTRVDYFSNPNVSYDGQATGVAEQCDNARTINASKHMVSRYR